MNSREVGLCANLCYVESQEQLRRSPGWIPRKDEIGNTTKINLEGVQTTGVDLYQALYKYTIMLP
jgi:hypothetical protein